VGGQGRLRARLGRLDTRLEAHHRPDARHRQLTMGPQRFTARQCIDVARRFRRTLAGRPSHLVALLRRGVLEGARLVFPVANSWSNGAGDSSNLFYSFNMRDSALLAARASNTPLAWTSSNTGPWTIHGQILDHGAPADLTALTFGSSSVDAVTGHVWYWGGKDDNVGYPSGIEIDPTTASYTLWRCPANGWAGAFRTWAVIADDLRLAVLGNAFDRKVYTLALTNVSAGFTEVTNTTGAGYWGANKGSIAYAEAGGV
jgi:hypothetical protein